MRQLKNKHEFNSAIIGILLGDGHMRNDHYLTVRHGGKQLQYVDETVEYLSKYIQPSVVRSSVDKAGYAFRYANFNSSDLSYLYNKIYINGKKTLTSKIINRIDEVTLAFLYMDDGCLCLRKKKKGKTVCIASREIYLSVNSFSFEEVECFQKHIERKFNISFHITTDKGHPRMWCNTENTIKFLALVAPIIHNFPTMYYKLDLKYKKKPINFLPKNITSYNL